MGDGVAFDQTQQLFGVETRLQNDQRTGGAHRVQRIDVGNGVIHRPCDHGADHSTGRNTVSQRHNFADPLSHRAFRRFAYDALRVPGGARSIDDIRPWCGSGAFIRRGVFAPFIPIFLRIRDNRGKTIGFRYFAWCRHLSHRHIGRETSGETRDQVGVDDDQPCAAVFENMRCLI